MAKTSWEAKSAGGVLIDSDGLDASITAATALDVSPYGKCGFQINVDNTTYDAVGTWSFEETIDGVNWNTITFNDGTTTIALASSTNLDQMVLLETCARMVRPVYTRTSGGGAGTSAWVHGHVVRK